MGMIRFEIEDVMSQMDEPVFLHREGSTEHLLTEPTHTHTNKQNHTRLYVCICDVHRCAYVQLTCTSANKSFPPL